MKPRPLQILSAALLLVAFPVTILPQQPNAPPQPPTPAATSPNASQPEKPKLPSSSQRRRANQIYLNGSKLYVAGRFADALALYQQAEQLDPTNPDYSAAVEVARSHQVTALVQAATKARLTGDNDGAQKLLRQAVELDPQNPEATQHLYELGDENAHSQTEPLYQQAAARAGAGASLRINPGRQSIHLHTDARALIQQVFRQYGITALVTDTVPPTTTRFDIDDADFAAAIHALTLATNTFYVTLDTHQVLVARDTRENLAEYLRQDVETVYLYGLSANELTDAANLAKNVYNVDQVASDASASSITLHGTPSSLTTFNAGMQSMMEGRDQVMLDVRIVQVAHTSARNTGTQLPQSVSAFNVYAEEQSILNANQALVQQIISSGLASPGDTLAILGILLASGQVSNSIFSNGLALFGGGLTQSGLSPSGPATFNFNLNTSDSRQLDYVQLRLGDGEAGSIKDGTRYPIQTSSYSSLSSSAASIAGLTGAGSSSSLSSLLASLSGTSSTIPMIQYQDLGLTLKVTPKVLRGDEVALSAEMTLDGLSGSTLDGNPIINHQAFTGVVTLKEGEAAELASQLDESQSKAITGTPGISDVPGLNNVMDKNIQKNYSTLLIIMTPHLVRSTQAAGASRRMVIEKGLNAQ